jgi:uncharacterized protein YjbJ (UPF0337 family)
MDANVFEGNWYKLKGDVRNKWGKLTDDDLERIGGNKDKLVGTLQERYGYMWDEARQMVDRYLDDYGQGGLKSKVTAAMSNENIQRPQEKFGEAVSKDNLQKMANDVVDTVRRYPIASLLIGLGIGYLLARRPDRYHEGR